MTSTSSPDWNARQYLKFEDDRTRPARELLARVPLEGARVVVDLGCGPGNSTELLVERYPESKVTGVDSSPQMLQRARERLPLCEFVEADLASWTPQEPPDLLFANAVFQWIPGHTKVIQRLVSALPDGGVLGIQMPDNTREPSHTIMQEVARRPPWASAFASEEAGRGDLPTPEAYYDLLRPLCRRIDIWHTVYNHVLESPEAIVEWFKGTALRPYLAALDSRSAETFLAAYTEEIKCRYALRVDGRVLLRFPRLFIVATK